MSDLDDNLYLPLKWCYVHMLLNPNYEPLPLVNLKYHELKLTIDHNDINTNHNNFVKSSNADTKKIKKQKNRDTKQKNRNNKNNKNNKN